MRSRGLAPRALAAIADLEARTVAADGGRLKLEFGVLRSRPSDEVNDLLWWDGGRLLGFLGLYGFGPPTIEVAGMVDPSARRQGIATALIEDALALAVERAYRQVLLVTPRNDAGGREFALTRGAEHEHSEHALVLDGPPADGPRDPRVDTRTAVVSDVADLERLLTAAFGQAPSDLAERMTREHAQTLMIERDGTVVGTVRLTLDGEVGGVYGFAVDPQWQGQGIGRDVLRRCCLDLCAQGAQRVGLEVAVENEHALGLYTSLGFARSATEDYYALPLS